MQIEVMTIMRKTHEIGPERPESAILHGLYIGSDAKLRGKAACISRCEGGWVVQVDDLASDFAVGWWKFPFEDWEQHRFADQCFQAFRTTLN